MKDRLASLAAAPGIPVEQIPVIVAVASKRGPAAPGDDAEPAVSSGGGRAARSQTIYARFQGAGGKWLCESHPDEDSCNRSCNARFAQALDMGAGTSCGCTTEKKCDEMVAP